MVSNSKENKQMVWQADLGNGGQYCSLYIERTKSSYKLCYLESTGDNEVKEEVVEEISIIEADKITFRINFSSKGSTFAYKIKEENWSNNTNAFIPTGAVWVGAKMGLYAITDKETAIKGKAYFDYFRVNATVEEAE